MPSRDGPELRACFWPLKNLASVCISGSTRSSPVSQKYTATRQGILRAAPMLLLLQREALASLQAAVLSCLSGHWVARQISDA